VPHSADPGDPDPNFIKWLKDNCVPIAGTVFGALVLCLVVHYSSTTVDWTRTKEFIDAFANVTQSLALIAGGIWAYFKFAKGRTFQDRLTLTVSGRFVSIDRSIFMVVTMQLKNAGLSRISFDRKVSSLVVSEYVPAEAAAIMTVTSNSLDRFEVFTDRDRYIEPNEFVERQMLIALPRASPIGYQVEFQVLSDTARGWRTTAIVEQSAFSHNHVG
jgi:hypothetical protein